MEKLEIIPTCSSNADNQKTRVKNIIGAPKMRKDHCELPIHIRLFSIAPCTVNAHNLLSFIFGIISLLYFPFYCYGSTNYCDGDSYSFSLLKTLVKSFPYFTIAIAIIEKADKKVINQCTKPIQKKKLRATTFAIAKLQER